MNTTLAIIQRNLLGSAAALALLVLTGCAHSISVAPDLNNIPAAGSKVAKSAGYVIAETNRWREVTTPGGGGDSVKYFPYKDLEPGFRKALSEVFEKVTKLSGPDDPAIAAQGLSFVITPTIATTSSSDSALTWPPTSFTIEFNCAVLDARGQPVTQISSRGKGRATFSEFKHEFALAARRAAEDALANLMRALAAAPELRR
jgi:hypothetical protein